MKVIGYHGGRAWDGPAEVRPPRKGRAEHGPGLYFTTDYDQARSYAKGGGQVRVAELELGPKFIRPGEWVWSMSVSEAEAFVVSSFPRQSHPKIMDDIRRSASRRASDRIDPIMLSNLALNHDLLDPRLGVELQKMLVEHGRPYEATSRSGNNRWEEIIVAYDAALVVRSAPLTAARFDGLASGADRWRLPMFTDQANGAAVWPEGMQAALIPQRKPTSTVKRSASLGVSL